MNQNNVSSKKLFETNPELLSEWHPTKNTSFSFQDLSFRSHKKVWWVCDRGHEWEKEVYVRARGSNCPSCPVSRTSVGVNDISSTHPEIAAQWHPILNKNKNILNYTKGSHEKIWWLLPCGHEIEQQIRRRKTIAEDCIYCRNITAKEGFNDLATTNPDIAKLWHPTKNASLTPSQITSQYVKKVWWLGKCRHEWNLSPKYMIASDHCRVCSNQNLQQGVNDLATHHQKLIKEWHPTKNNSLIPANFLSISYAKVWWLGECNHEWEASIGSRTKKKTGCPYCTNQKTLTGFNDLATTHPDLTSEWHPTLNKNITPNTITSGSQKKAWWLCNKGHEWETLISSRKNGSKCPSCSTTTSIAEQDIINHIKTIISSPIITNDRTILHGKELDIYLPHEKIAIEFNGIYWHSEAAGKTKNYHYDKWKTCKDKNIQLIQIWEDDYNHNPELIKKMLSHKIKNSNTKTKTIYARNTTIKTIQKNEAEKFLNQNHIQGYAAGTYYISLQNNQKTIAVMVLKKENTPTQKNLNIIRYATNINIPGGFSKIIKHIEKQYNPNKIITFSDNCVSDGNLYSTNNFTATTHLKPDYMYVYNGQRKHKFGFRKTKFANNPKLQYDPTLTEKELATLNKIPRIWDAGKIKWEKTVTDSNNTTK